MSLCRASTLACRLQTILPRPPVRQAARWFHAATANRCERCVPPPPEPHVPSADHRALGSSLNLFSVTKYSPGSPLFHPDGSHVFLKLQAFLRAQYAAFGFEEVISPTIYKQSLWEKSGHWDNYKDDMFEVTGRGARGVEEGKEIGEDESYGLKPMNCPGHCLLYKSQTRSYRDLPIRYADFSPLHRNEVSGALTGLTRVRRFHQDDGHIFCQPSQVGAEIEKTLQLIDIVYDAFGLGLYKLVLSTRPETDYIGTVEEWDRAESQLRRALEASGVPWALNPGDGAFYGPKIDIILRDSTGKEHQTATVQLDFQLPARFELTYVAPTSHNHSGSSATALQQQQQSLSENGKSEDAPARPVLIHRAVLGSLERFLALLIEHTRGHWPFWLSPRQAIVLSVDNSPETRTYASKVTAELRGLKSTASSPSGESSSLCLQPLNALRYRVDTDKAEGDSLGARIRAAKMKRYNLVCVVGSKEVDNGTVVVDLEGMPQMERVLSKARKMLGDNRPVEVTEVKEDQAVVGPNRKKKPGAKVTLSVEQLKELMRWMGEQYL